MHFWLGHVFLKLISFNIVLNVINILDVFFLSSAKFQKKRSFVLIFSASFLHQFYGTCREEEKKTEVGNAEDALEAVRKESQQKAQEIMQRLG